MAALSLPLPPPVHRLAKALLCMFAHGGDGTHIPLDEGERDEPTHAGRALNTTFQNIRLWSARRDIAAHRIRSIAAFAGPSLAATGLEARRIAAVSWSRSPEIATSTVPSATSSVRRSSRWGCMNLSSSLPRQGGIRLGHFTERSYRF